MRSPIEDYLQEVLAGTEDGGEVASYIPELAQADPERLAAALCTADGTVYAAGDTAARFSIQSMSKPFAYALALEEHGIDRVLQKVGVEPSGDSFNSASLDPSDQRPDNPMINIGAIATHALILPEGSRDERDERVRLGLSAFAGRELAVEEAVYASEIETAFRNLSLAYLVRSADGFGQDPHEIVEGYTRQCALSVDVRDLAVMAMTLAAGGVNPVTTKRVVSAEVAQQVLSVMTMCGMYDAAGDWMTHVGIPAKSGVSGGVIGGLPGQVGLSVFSPRLDRVGHSVRGVQVFERFSREMGMHLLTSPPLSVDAVRSITRTETGRGQQRSFALQGPLRFSSAEQVLRQFERVTPGDFPVALDLSRVTSFDPVARRMVLEGLRRLREDGHPILLADPKGVLPEPDLGDGSLPERLDA